MGKKEKDERTIRVAGQVYKAYPIRSFSDPCNGCAGNRKRDLCSALPCMRNRNVIYRRCNGR